MSREELSAVQSAIETLIKEGAVILQVVQPDGNSIYFSVYRFQESYFNTAQSVDFNSVDGVNITAFLSKNAALWRNRVEFLGAYQRTIAESDVVRFEFSKDVTWYKYAMSVTPKK